jgi:NTP pyrophosphatase (non-canonical NTP hydrolase)
MTASNSYEQLNTRLLKFRDDRDWKQFHTIQSLVTSVAIEAGELLELTQWKDTEACQKLADSEDLRDECADVLLYLMELADCGRIRPVTGRKRQAGQMRRKIPRGQSTRHVEEI